MENFVLDKDVIKHRATMMGIKSGKMPDVGFIWAVQRAENISECFGQGLGCQVKNCRWRIQCRALDFYADLSLPIAPEARRVQSRPPRTIVECEAAPAEALESNPTASSRS